MNSFIPIQSFAMKASYDKVVDVSRKLEIERSTAQSKPEYNRSLDTKVEQAIKNSLGLIKLYTLFKTAEYCARSNSATSPFSSLSMQDVFKSPDERNYLNDRGVQSISFTELYHYALNKANQAHSNASMEEISKEFIQATYKAGMQASLLITHKAYFYCVFKFVNFFCTHTLLRAKEPIFSSLINLSKTIQKGFTDQGTLSNQITQFLTAHKEILTKSKESSTDSSDPTQLGASKKIDRLWREQIKQTTKNPSTVKNLYRKFETKVIDSCFPSIKLSSFATKAIRYINQDWFKNVWLNRLHKLLTLPIQIVLASIYLALYLIDIILTWVVKQICIMTVHRLQVAESCLNLVDYDTHTSSISTGVTIAINQLLEILIYNMRTADTHTTQSNPAIHSFDKNAKTALNDLVKSLLHLTDFKEGELRTSIEEILPLQIEKAIYQCDEQFMKERYLELLDRLQELMTRLDNGPWPTPKESNKAQTELENSIKVLTDQIVYELAADTSPHLTIHPTQYDPPQNLESLQNDKQNILNALKRFKELYTSLSTKNSGANLNETEAEEERSIYSILVVHGSGQCFSDTMRPSYIEMLKSMVEITHSVKQSGLTDAIKTKISSFNLKKIEDAPTLSPATTLWGVSSPPSSPASTPVPTSPTTSPTTSSTTPVTTYSEMIYSGLTKISSWGQNIFSALSNLPAASLPLVKHIASTTADSLLQGKTNLIKGLITQGGSRKYDPEGPAKVLNEKIKNVTQIIQEKSFLTAFIRETIIAPIARS